MEIPRYCRDCCFRTGETEIYTCAYALLTGRTRKAQPVGEGCTFKIKGERSTKKEVQSGRQPAPDGAVPGRMV